MYVPTVVVETVPVTTICGVKLPSSRSVAVAPGSTNGVFTIIESGFAPMSVMVGGVFAGVVHDASCALTSSLYNNPAGLICGVELASPLFVTVNEIVFDPVFI